MANEPIRKTEFVLNAETELAGKSQEYITGFIHGVKFLIDYSYREVKELSEEPVQEKGENND